MTSTAHPGDVTDVDRSWRRFLPGDDVRGSVVYETDLQGLIVWASPSAHALLGWRPEDLVGTSARDLFHEVDLARIDALRERYYSDQEQYRQVSCLIRTSSGGYRSMMLGARPMIDANGATIGSLVQLDDTQDRDSVLRALATLSAANRLVVRATDETVLLQRMCETVVGTGRYLYCWYGRRLEDEDQTVAPVAQAGESAGYLDEVRISWGDNPFGQGPTGRSLRLMKTQVSNDQSVDPQFTPWREAASRRGFHASISLPVFVDEVLDGALIAYAAEPYAFDALAQDLLEDLATDLGYGMQRLRAIAERDAAALQRTESEQRFRLLAENSSDVIMLSTADMTLTWVSPSAEEAFGYPPDQLVGRNAAFLIHPDDLPVVITEVQRTQVSKTSMHFRHRIIRADGSIHWVDVAAGHIEDDGTGQPGRVVSLRDVDAEVRAEKELEAREEKYRLLAENASDIVWQTTSNGVITWVSPSITPVLGWSREDVTGHSGTDFIHPEDQGLLTSLSRTALAAGSPQVEVRVRAKHDGHRWMALAIRSVETPDGMTRIVAMRDIQDQVTARQRMEFVLGHDVTTGLPNRTVMVDRIRSWQSQLERFRTIGVLCVGVDGLAEVNEALGHSAGDLFITTMAGRVAEAVGNPEGIGRGAGNELLVVIPDLRNGSDAATLASRIRADARGPVDVAGQTVNPSISIGIATGGRGVDPEQLIRDASLALRKAKDAGGDHHEFADPGLAIEAQQRLALDAEIRDAVREGAFQPWFQPIVDLSSGKTVGYEALARWIRPSGPALPGAFLAIAERSSLIVDIDLTIMVQAVATLASLPDPLFISINVSAATLSRAPYAEHVMSALLLADVQPSRLHIEVTETMLLDPAEAASHTIRQLATAGVQWYIDDFGTGYASITSLRDLPMTGLKLDRSFTHGITSMEPTSIELAQALVGLAAGLRLDTVAEGIERQPQAEKLRDLGWKHGQGWLYGKAEPLALP